MTTTKWERVYEDLRRRIVEGEFPPGSELPSIYKLVRRYGVATNTVRPALHRLRKEGVLRIEQGKSMVVLRTPTERPITELIVEMGAAVAAVAVLWEEIRSREWGRAPGGAAGPRSAQPPVGTFAGGAASCPTSA